jgi:hypothetical protein
LISAAPTNGTPNELADWLELEVLASLSGVALLSSINEHLELDEDFEPADLDDENLRAEERLLHVASAVEERIRTIGAAYPFRVDSAGARLTLVDPYCEAACAYLFCLVVSNAASDGHLTGEGPWAPDLALARGLFQICATAAAAGYAEGPAFALGWPRDDETAFLEKLRAIYEAFGEGTVHATAPPGAPSQVKDDSIDVIAWKYDSTRGPGTCYFLGQAASGANWPAKSLKGLTDLFHNTWFTRPPRSTAITLTIMPFRLPTAADATTREAQEVVDGEHDRLAWKHGIVLFRHSVAKYIARAVELKALFTIELIDQLPKLCTYVASYRITLRSAIESLS